MVNSFRYNKFISESNSPANPTAFSNLSPATKTAKLPAMLTTETGEVLFTFLFNPENISYSRNANYAEVGVGSANVLPQQYFNTSGKSIQLNDLLIDTYNEGLSAGNIISSLHSLMVPSVASTSVSKVPEPPTVYFLWGNRSIGPCKVTNLSVSETGWLSGEFAVGRVSLTLIEIPAKPSASQTTLNTGLQNTRPKSYTELAVTARQREAITSNVKKFISQNVSKVKITDTVSTNTNTSSSAIDNLLRQSLKDNTYKVDVSNIGRVLLTIANSYLYEALPDDKRRILSSIPANYTLNRVLNRGDVI